MEYLAVRRFTNQKPILAIDIDDVLAHLIDSPVEVRDETFGDSPSHVRQSSGGSDYHRVWGNTEKEGFDKMDSYFASKHFKENFKAIAGAFEALSELKREYELQVVTARPLAVEQATTQWINDTFPGIFAHINYVNQFSSNSGRSRSKADICHTIGAVMLIDDSILYMTQSVTSGIPVLLFGDYPWNKEVPFGLVEDWQSYQYNSHHSSTGERGISSNTAVPDSSGCSSAESVSVTSTVDDASKNDTPRPSTSAASNSNSSSNHVIYRVRGWHEIVPAVHAVLRGMRDAGRARSITGGTTSSDDGVVVPKNACDFDFASATLTVAAVQMCSVNNITANLATIRRLVQQAVLTNQNVKLICLPECCIYMGENATQTIMRAAEVIADGEDVCDSAIAQLCVIAKEQNVFLSIGGFPELRPDVLDRGNCMSNAHLIISDQGEVMSPIYRKIHLFDSPLAGLQESLHTVAGDRLVTIPVSGFNIGLSICYDLRFPGFFEALCKPMNEGGGTSETYTGGGGAEIVLVPSAFTQPTGAAHWEVLLRARAIENQCYVVAPAQSGQHNEKRMSYGHTMIIDPWGTIVSQLADEDEGVCIARLTKKKLRSVRTNMPVLTHRRTDLY